MLLMTALALRAQEKINYDFDITRPLVYYSAQEDLGDLVKCNAGSSWSLQVKDFGTAGNIVRLKAVDADGNAFVSKSWQDVTVLYIQQDNGNDSYAIVHGGYRYAIVLEGTEKDGSKAWLFFNSTARTSSR